MNDLFWLMLLFPLGWPFLAKIFLSKKLNWWETGINIASTTLLAIGLWYAGTSFKAASSETLNGEVTGKHEDTVSCEHSYSCNCRSYTYRDSNGKTHTGTKCDTCYKHLHDYSWRVDTTLGQYTIDRVDEQGRREPQRWTSVTNGDPVAASHLYMNWIKATDSSLFSSNPVLAARYKDKLPAYPDQIFDYYRINRLVTDGVTVPDAASWNEDISNILRQLGPKRQANVIIVITKDDSPDFATALRANWQGAEKNDVVVVIGTPAYPAIAWARTFSWSKDETVNIEIRDRLQDLGTIDREKIISIVNDEVDGHFVRRPMADFDYLKGEIEPPLAVVILCFLIAVPGTLVLSYVFYRIDVNPMKA